MLLKLYPRLCFVSMDNFIHACAFNEQLYVTDFIITHTFLLSPPVPSAPAFRYLLHISYAQHGKNWTHLSFLLSPTPYFSNPLFFRILDLDKCYHHSTHLSWTEKAVMLNTSFHHLYVHSITKSCLLIFLTCVLSFIPLSPCLYKPPTSSAWPLHSLQLFPSLTPMTHSVLSATTRVNSPAHLIAQHACFNPF